MTDLCAEGSRDLRIQLLKEQRAIQCNADLALAIESAGLAIEVLPLEKFVKQGGYEDDVYFIIRGSVFIETSGHRHANRHHGCHVGEMALLDPGSGRSADIIAGERGATVIKVSGSEMRSIGDTYPTLWRGIARDISERLRGRDSLFVEPNDIPVVFIASSGAAKAVLDRVSCGLNSRNIKVNPWTDPDIFTPSGFTLDSLLAQSEIVDFAVIIATPDDLVRKNSIKFWRIGNFKQAARDNVLLEFGLFAGSLERQRVFVLEKNGVGLPTDMQGLTTLRFGNESELDQNIDRIARYVRQIGPIKRLRRRPLS